MSNVKRTPAFVDTEEYRKRITPHIVRKPGDLHLFECSHCHGVLFDPLASIVRFTPFEEPITGTKAVRHQINPVQVCRGCEAHYTWVDGQMYEITKIVDVTAWKEAEKAENNAGGPGVKIV